MTGLATNMLAFAGLLAADETGGGSDGMGNSIVAAVISSAIGLVVLTVSIILMSKLMPLPFWKEIEEDQNTALGIMVGSIVIGISIIIAAAIHG